jgi:hypothetical protein
MLLRELWNLRVFAARYFAKIKIRREFVAPKVGRETARKFYAARMALIAMRPAAGLADGSFASIFERTKLRTARLAMVRIIAAAIKRAFFPLRILSPNFVPCLRKDLTLLGKKGPVLLVPRVSISQTELINTRITGDCTPVQKDRKRAGVCLYPLVSQDCKIKLAEARGIRDHVDLHDSRRGARPKTPSFRARRRSLLF